MNKIAIYGAGAFGEIFYSALNGKMDFFIDDYSQKDFFLNKPIRKIVDVSKDTYIYISILQHSTTIEKELQDNGFENIINFTDSIFKIPNILQITAKSKYLWLIENREKMFNTEKLKKVFLLLKDEKSKNLLKTIIHLRTTLDTKYYIRPEGKEYFPTDVPILENIKNGIYFVDCGAYIGDTIKELLKQDACVKTTISFEPDSKNIVSLNKELQVQSTLHHLTNFFTYPAGVYSSNTILNFANNGIDSSASLDTDSTFQIPVVSLDSTILNTDVNYIKMDIEGAEKEALLGARETIQRHKPNLAICLYHKPEDLWELPLLIKEIEPSYDMYIRVHEDMCLSTVLYCISRN